MIVTEVLTNGLDFDYTFLQGLNMAEGLAVYDPFVLVLPNAKKIPARGFLALPGMDGL